ncbi:MAG: hypothetical protein E6H58_18660 [Betaproteobacteria bacterium]|nr:MAG: hypothetical protein E6H58_18660 [Betaproteobacteria bacterium]
MNVNKSPSQATDTVADQAAQGGESAIKATQRAAHETIDQLSEKASEMRDRAAPIINRVATQAEELARRSADAVRETSQQLRDRAVRVSDSTVGYVKDEPLKSILIAAAAGAALMALVTLLSRRDRD